MELNGETNLIEMGIAWIFLAVVKKLNNGGNSSKRNFNY